VLEKLNDGYYTDSMAEEEYHTLSDQDWDDQLSGHRDNGPAAVNASLTVYNDAQGGYVLVATLLWNVEAGCEIQIAYGWSFWQHGRLVEVYTPPGEEKKPRPGYAVQFVPPVGGVDPLVATVMQFIDLETAQREEFTLRNERDGSTSVLDIRTTYLARCDPDSKKAQYNHDAMDDVLPLLVPITRALRGQVAASGLPDLPATYCSHAFAHILHVGDELPKHTDDNVVFSLVTPATVATQGGNLVVGDPDVYKCETQEMPTTMVSKDFTCFARCLVA
jgi:hypothetical protein